MIMILNAMHAVHASMQGTPSLILSQTPFLAADQPLNVILYSSFNDTFLILLRKISKQRVWGPIYCGYDAPNGLSTSLRLLTDLNSYSCRNSYICLCLILNDDHYILRSCFAHQDSVMNLYFFRKKHTSVTVLVQLRTLIFLKTWIQNF